MNATSPLKAAELVNVYGTGLIQLDGGLEDVGKKMRNSFNWIMKAIREARGEPRSYSSASTAAVSSCYDEDVGHSRSSSGAASARPEPSETVKDRDGHSAFRGLVGSAGHITSPVLSGQRSPTPPTQSEVIQDQECRAEVGPPGFETDTLSQIGQAYSCNSKTPSNVQESDTEKLVTTAESDSAGLDVNSNSRAATCDSQTGPPAKKEQPGDDDRLTLNGNSGFKPLPIRNRHAAQKAIVTSQRGSDVDLHLDKDDIIDKFAFATVSGNEPSFVDQFLIIFRRFATPFDVLSALVSRFEFVSGHLESDPLLTRYAHMKICHVLMIWIETYPGDFAKPTMMMVLKAFNLSILTATWLLHYGTELMHMSRAVANMVDEDVGWALPDTTDEATVEKFLNGLPRLKATFNPVISTSKLKNIELLEDQPSPVMTSSSHGAGTKSATDSISIEFQGPRRTRADTSSSQDRAPTLLSDHTPVTAESSPLFAVSEPPKFTTGDASGGCNSAESFAELSLSHKTTVASSLQIDQKGEYKTLAYCAHQLMGISEDMIALQITRLEWDIFAEMKPRHLIRYVLAPRDPKNPRVSLRDPNSPIARSTDYLNHLAVWASSMILIQEKLKNRARMLLKLMKVAYELRDMDDFHSLMGVLAGIEAQPVYRLEATFEVVQQMDLQAYRRYLSLKKLMSSQKSFSAYRLARQTASAQCVPYLGTYLQDITAINEVKDDMRDGKVNLTKFLQISKSAATVLLCEKLAPEIQVDEKLENLITRAPVLSEDAQYEFSYKYKARAVPYHLQNPSQSNSHHAGLSASSHGTGNAGKNQNNSLFTHSNVTVGPAGAGPTGHAAKKGTRKLKQLFHNISSHSAY